MTRRADSLPRSAMMPAVGDALSSFISRRSARMEMSLRRRPSLRERRAVTPRRSQCSSALSWVSRRAKVARVFFFDGVGPFLERRVAAIELEQPALAQPERRGRDAFEKAAVVADDEAGAALACDGALQLFDGSDVEVVGGLVEQQDVCIGREGARERGAAGFAAGKPLRRALGIEAELFECGVGGVGGCDGGAADAGYRWRLRVVTQCCEAFETGFLRRKGDGCAGLIDDLAAIGIGETRHHAHQCRLAGAVGADERGALALLQHELSAVEQRRSAKRQP